MNVAVLIPARGGSQGIPRKNLQPIGAISLVGRAVITSLAVTPRVWVSTDDRDIAAEAVRYGAGVVDRPDDLATDGALSIDVIRHAFYELPGLSSVDVFCYVQCTAPLMTAEDIRRTATAAMTSDLAVAVVPFSGVVMDNAGNWINWLPLDGSNRQNRDPQYQVAGSVWAFQPDYLLRRWGSGDIRPVVSDNPTFLDIDTREDLDVARKLLASAWVESTGPRFVGRADVFPNWQGQFFYDGNL